MQEAWGNEWNTRLDLVLQGNNDAWLIEQIRNESYTLQAGTKRYELANHLGNVLAVVSDKKMQTDGVVWQAELVSAQDYFPFGMAMPGRSTDAKHRYGFNGKETDPETGIQDYGMRWYLPNIARFPSVDPITSSYPELTPYQFASNTPIKCIDLEADAPPREQPVPVLRTPSNVHIRAESSIQLIGGKPKRQVGKGNQPYLYNFYVKMAYAQGNHISFTSGDPFRTTTSPFANTLMFTALFDHYLSKRFIHHYTIGAGTSYEMNEQEMIDVHAAPIGLQGLSKNDIHDFNFYLDHLKTGETVKLDSWTVEGYANTAGTLGRFTVRFDGQLLKGNGNSWSFSGTMQFIDSWDFETNKANEEGTIRRNPSGDLQTSIGKEYLWGQGFSVTSPKVTVTQTSAQTAVDWFQNKSSSIVPNKVAPELHQYNQK